MENCKSGIVGIILFVLWVRQTNTIFIAYGRHIKRKIVGVVDKDYVNNTGFKIFLFFFLMFAHFLHQNTLTTTGQCFFIKAIHTFIACDIIPVQFKYRP